MSERMKEIRERVEKVDPAWGWSGREVDDDGFIYHPQGSYLGNTMICLGDTYEDDNFDLDFISQAPADITYLLGEVERLRESIQEIRAVAESPAGSMGMADTMLTSIAQIAEKSVTSGSALESPC